MHLVVLTIVIKGDHSVDEQFSIGGGHFAIMFGG